MERSLRSDPSAAEPARLRLLRALIRDRERDLVRLNARVKNLVLEQRRRLSIKEDTCALFFDYLVVLGRQRNDAQLEVRLRARRIGNQTQTTRLRHRFRRG